MSVNKEKSKNTIMTRNDAGKLSVLARGLNLGVKYKTINISDENAK